MPDLISLRRILSSLIEKIGRGSSFSSMDRQPDSYLFFTFYSLRRAGLSFLEASSILAQSSRGSGRIISHIANAFGKGASDADSSLSSKINRWEQLLNIRDGTRSRLLLMETGIRNLFKIGASYMQIKLIVLTFFLFVVPFSALVSWFYLFPAKLDLLVFFFLLYPPFLSLISEWARMNNEELVH